MILILNIFGIFRKRGKNDCLSKLPKISSNMTSNNFYGHKIITNNFEKQWSTNGGLDLTHNTLHTAYPTAGISTLSPRLLSRDGQLLREDGHL